jgi:hypothetical protein
MDDVKNDLCYLIIVFYSDRVLISFDRVLTPGVYSRSTYHGYSQICKAIKCAINDGFYLLPSKYSNKLVYAGSRL